MSPEARYKVIPLRRVQQDAKKLLSPQQLAEGIALAKRLCFYPSIPELSIEPCGEAMELRLEGKAIDRRGWLRAMFYVHNPSKTIYIVDLFWKQTNTITLADKARTTHRVKQLKLLLAAAKSPPQSSGA
jgi:hypothetical protein